MLLPRPVDTAPSRKRLPDRVLLSLYVPPHERIHPPTGMVAPELEGRSSIPEAPSTRRNLRLRICATSIPIISMYLWQLAQSSIPSRSPSTWIRRPSNRWSKTEFISVIMTFTDRLSWYVLIFSTRLLVMRSNFLLTFLLQVVMPIWNMDRQHREFQSRLDDAENCSFTSVSHFQASGFGRFFGQGKI